MIVRLKHVHRVRKPDGRVFYYHRRTRERLPDDPEARARRVLEINAGRLPVRLDAAPGSFADLVTLYRLSPDFRRLAKKTRADYERRLRWMEDRWSALDVETIDREAVLALRDALAVHPRSADLTVAVLRRLLAFALDRPSRFGLAHNPAIRPGRLSRPRPGANRPWSSEEVERALACDRRAVRVAVALAVYTGQRQGDVLRMTWHAIQAGAVAVRQAKTGAELLIPVHARLRAILAAEERRAVTIVTGERGRSLTPDGFRAIWRATLARAALAGAGLTFHGLRHTAATRLAEAGCTALEIRAITGHATAAMLERYTARADQRRLAVAAVAKLERTADDAVNAAVNAAPGGRLTR